MEATAEFARKTCAASDRGKGTARPRFQILSRSRTKREIDETKARNTSDTLETLTLPARPMAFPLQRGCITRPTVTIMRGGSRKKERRGRKLGVREKGDVSWDSVFLEDGRFKRSEFWICQVSRGWRGGGSRDGFSDAALLS